MRTVANLLAASEKLDIEFLARLAFIDAGDEYVRLQREQLGEGVLSTGKALTNVLTGSDEYSPSYAKYKGRKKPIDLHDKGDFWAGIFITDNDTDLVVDSVDEKSGMLQENYSPQILGLDDDYKSKFTPYAGTALVGRYTEELNRR